MSWINEILAPKIKSFLGGRNSTISENTWTKCIKCERMLYTKDLEANLMVCNYCSYHLRLPPIERLKSLFDSNYQDIPLVDIKDDPLKFKDLKKYTNRLKDARQKTGMQDAVMIGLGEVNKIPTVIFVMNFDFMGGSMGLCVGKSFCKAVQTAIDKHAAFVSVTASGGARMQEGMLSLMQMPATIAAICMLKEARLPFINIFTNPTTGGVLASFATIGDIHIAEPNALIGFAGARVIEKTIKSKLPDNFQSSEFLQSHGLIDIISHRSELKNTLGNVLSYVYQ